MFPISRLVGRGSVPSLKWEISFVLGTKSLCLTASQMATLKYRTITWRMQNRKEGEKVSLLLHVMC